MSSKRQIISDYILGKFRELDETKAKLERTRSALKVLYTWATFKSEAGNLKAGFYLVPEHVANLCQRTLEETV